MGHDRAQHKHDSTQGLVHYCAVGIFAAQLAQLVTQFHHRGYRGVEFLPLAVVVTDLGNGLVQFTADIFLPFIQAVASDATTSGSR